MKLLIHKYSKRNSFLMLFFFLFIFIVVGTANIKGQQINVCNKGKVSVWVASLRYIDDFWWGDSWRTEGWYEAKPNSFFCTVIGGYGVSNVVFGLSTPDKGFGVIKYSFESIGGGLSERLKLKEICVKDDSMEYFQKSSSGLVPPCPSGWVAVPTSISVFEQGKVTLTLNVDPSEDEYKLIDVFVREPIKPEIPVKVNTNEKIKKSVVVKKTSKKKSIKPKRKRR